MTLAVSPQIFAGIINQNSEKNLTQASDLARKKKIQIVSVTNLSLCYFYTLGTGKSFALFQSFAGIILTFW